MVSLCTNGDSRDARRRVALVLNGRPADVRWIGAQLSTMSGIVVADGGAEVLRVLGVVPDYWVGDGDSSSEELSVWLRDHRVVCVQYDPSKAHTDGYLALQTVLATMEPDELYLLQGLGGRFDHQLATLGVLRLANHELLARYQDGYDVQHAGLATIVDQSEQITILPSMTMQLRGESGCHFSLQAYGGEVTGLTISGAEYELQSYSLVMGEDLTISNRFTESVVRIDWQTGELLLWVEGGCSWQKLS